MSHPPFDLVRLPEAIREWRDALGEQHVTDEPRLLAEANATTFDYKSEHLAILRPDSSAQVQQCLAIAQRYCLPIYPVSGGKNWGLGSRVSPCANAVLLDLARLNQIVEYNAELAYITLQPGVTFQQVHDYLVEQGAESFLAVTGGPPNGSVIGNVMERGDGTGPYGQRPHHVCAMEVVTPNGECLRTGFDRFVEASAAKTHPFGVGPQLDGLFMQSNLGVVTELTIWLTPFPKYFQEFTCQISGRSALSDAVDQMRCLLLHRVIEPNCVGIWNVFKYYMAMKRYPWDEMQGKTPLRVDSVSSQPWFVSGAVYAANELIGATHMAAIGDSLASCTQTFDAFAGRQNVLLGVPTWENSAAVYWRKDSPSGDKSDPDRDRVGLIWLCHALPLLGETVTEACDIIEPLVLKHGFEPSIGINPTSGRSCHIYTAITFDRDVEGEDQRALDCHHEVMAALAERGHLPYRLSLLDMGSLPSSRSDYDKVLSEIKSALDPNRILAPGRYDFG